MLARAGRQTVDVALETGERDERLGGDLARLIAVRADQRRPEDLVLERQRRGVADVRQREAVSRP